MMRRARARLAAAAAAATLDALAHRLGHPPARAAVRFGTALAVLGIARAAGVSYAELGLGRRELGRGARTGAVAGACAAAAVLAGAAVPATRGFFLDDRAAAAAGPGGLAAGLARITFAVVPPEELTYRSALLGLWLGNGSPASAVAWSSALFGLSHILPTRSTMGQTALGQHLERRPLRQAAFVAGNVAVTGAAGAVFAGLRLRSGSVLAPLLAHAALNDAALLAGRAAHRLSRDEGPAARPGHGEGAGRGGRPPGARNRGLLAILTARARRASSKAGPPGPAPAVGAYEG
jgi:membrane protease YdiL (CAAX protease family)